MEYFIHKFDEKKENFYFGKNYISDHSKEILKSNLGYLSILIQQHLGQDPVKELTSYNIMVFSMIF